MKKQLNHTEALDAVYVAIAYLRHNGKKPSISEVSATSGVSRATLYTKHDDWTEVRDVIKNNKTTRRVKEAKVSLGKKAAWEKDLDQLNAQVELYEDEINGVKEMADSVYSQLLDQLHKYILLSRETPSNRQRNANLLKESAELRQRIKQLERENRDLKAERGMSADVRALFQKEVIKVNKPAKLDEITQENMMDVVLDIVNSLDDYFSEVNEARTPKAVYIMCGNYASGKSSWIKEHNPEVGGVNLYIDGTNHTAVVRKSLVKRVRKLSRTCKIVCVRCMATLDQCVKRNELPVRKKSDASVDTEILKQIDREFDEVTVDEGFDEIVVS